MITAWTVVVCEDRAAMIMADRGCQCTKILTEGLFMDDVEILTGVLRALVKLLTITAGTPVRQVVIDNYQSCFLDGHDEMAIMDNDITYTEELEALIMQFVELLNA